MTWFHICTANHVPSGKLSLTDQIEWVSAGLLDAGHCVSISETHVEPGAINLFWECFTPFAAKSISDLGVEYGIIATEIPDGRGFNWREEAWWLKRYEAFFIAASKASFIWVLVESAMNFFSRLAPVAYLELGFSERLIPPYINETPFVDFSFFGQRTPYRENAIQKIRKYATVDWPDEFMSHEDVHAMIARSKIGLNFKQSEQWLVPSGPRLGRLLLAKRGIACEYLPIATRQGEIAGLCPLGLDFTEFALSMVRSDWKTQAEYAFDEYRNKMPMKEIMQNVIDATVGKNRFPSNSLIPKFVDCGDNDDFETEEQNESTQLVGKIDYERKNVIYDFVLSIKNILRKTFMCRIKNLFRSIYPPDRP